MSLDLLKAKVLQLQAEREAKRPPRPADEPGRMPLCVYEGPVVSACVTCGGVRAESRHLRSCNHPHPSNPDRDTCTRTLVSHKAQACDRCPDRQASPAPEFSILMTGGIGDAFALEAMLTPADRDRLSTLYLGAPAAREIAELFRALPNYPQLKIEILPTGQRTHYTLAAVERHIRHRLPAHVQDWSIRAIFPRRLPYQGSSFLAHRLAAPVLPDRPYVVIAPASSWGRWEGRNFTPEDWKACLDFLDSRNLLGVVLMRERLPVPRHPRLYDWQGTTTVRESVEVLKGAAGYLGVDTCWSVLSAKLFPPARMSVKSVWNHCYANARSYFTPATEFPFLQRQLVAPAWD